MDYMTIAIIVYFVMALFVCLAVIKEWTTENLVGSLACGLLWPVLLPVTILEKVFK